MSKLYTLEEAKEQNIIIREWYSRSGYPGYKGFTIYAIGGSIMFNKSVINYVAVKDTQRPGEPTFISKKVNDIKKEINSFWNNKRGI